MSKPIIEVRHLSKRYKLGATGATSLRDELSNFWTRIRHPGTARDRPIASAKHLDLAAAAIRGDGPRSGPADFWALRDISFEVQRGEVIGIIGRNGAGKSTLLKLLSRVTQQTEGEITLRGRVASLLEVGTGFHPDLTGRENVFLNGAIFGMRKAEIRAKFDEIVAFAEVEQFIDTPVKRYSSGMYVRLAFAVAAHLDPEILIIDEVLAVGDSEFQKKCIGKMGEGTKKGITTLIVSHNMAIVNNLCNRAVLLNHGQVECIGPVAEVTQRYMTTKRAVDGQNLWPDPATAPGNEIARLRAVRILQDGIDGPTGDVDISKEVRVEIEYENLRAGESLYTALWLRDQHGTFVLSTGSAQYVSATDDGWHQRPRPVGLYKSVCVIPGNFLNDSLYSVTAILGKSAGSTLVLQDYAVSFQVHDSGEMRQEFYGNWIGTVRPRLAWSTDLIRAGV